MLSASVFLLPFLFLLDKAAGGGWFASAGVPIALSSLVYIWLCYFLLRTKFNIWNKIGLIVLGAAVLSLIIQIIAQYRLGGDGFDPWDLISPIATVFIAVLFFAIGRFVQKSK